MTDKSLAELAQIEASAVPSLPKQLIISDGSLSVTNGASLEQNMALIIIEAWTHHRAFFSKPYVGGTYSTPDCHAYGKHTGSMSPPAYCIPQNGYLRQNKTCAECPHSQWGSSRNGTGQACRLSVHIHCRLVGCVHKEGLVCVTDKDTVSHAQCYLLRLSPTMIKAFYGHVRMVTESHQLPLCGVVSMLSVRKHPKNKSECLWSVHEELDEGVVRMLARGPEEQSKLLEFRPSPVTEPIRDPAAIEYQE